MSHCYCSMCRKAHGSGYSTYVMVKPAEFRWVRGEDEVVSYESSPGFHRPFCPTCGSVVPRPEPDQEYAGIPAGCLDDDPGIRPAAHIFTASKAPWVEIPDDGLPRFDVYPPGYGGEVERGPAPANDPEVVRGSCLCGSVHYEVDRPIRLLYGCLCSRCRKASASAHDLLARAPRSAFRWTAGEELVTKFHLPESERFDVSFCKRCGGALPVVRDGFEEVGIPSGSFDDDPGVRTSALIYVGSKAPWVEFDERIPHFEET